MNPFSGGISNHTWRSLNAHNNGRFDSSGSVSRAQITCSARDIVTVIDPAISPKMTGAIADHHQLLSRLAFHHAGNISKAGMSAVCEAQFGGNVFPGTMIKRTKNMQTIEASVPRNNLSHTT